MLDTRYYTRCLYRGEQIENSKLWNLPNSDGSLDDFLARVIYIYRFIDKSINCENNFIPLLGKIILCYVSTTQRSFIEFYLDLERNSTSLSIEYKNSCTCPNDTFQATYQIKHPQQILHKRSSRPREVHPPQGRFVHCLYLSPAIYQTFSSSWRVPIRKRGGSRRRDKGTYETDNAFSGASRNEETCPGGRQPAK